jgi:hypothetical protein
MDGLSEKTVARDGNCLFRKFKIIAFSVQPGLTNKLLQFNGFYHPSKDNSDMSDFLFYLTFYSIIAGI